MEMNRLIEKSRLLHRLLQRSAAQTLEYDGVTEELAGVLGSEVYIIDKKGRVLGQGGWKDVRGGFFFPGEILDGNLNDDCRRWMEGFKQSEINIMPTGRDMLCMVTPIQGAGGPVGIMLYAREAPEYEPEEVLLAEYGAGVTGMQMQKKANERLENEARKKTVVQMALEVLSYSELEAVKYIFNEIEGSEGFLVASKLAEQYKLTRSVIVNALRKLESAGVIDARSLGMKGTYIKILNDFLYEGLAQV
jgi:transcriptional pleiotropic repressor